MREVFLRRAILWGVVIILIMGSVWVLWEIQKYSNSKEDLQIPKEGFLSSPVSKLDWARGNTKDPKITLVEYSDFQCPACGAYYPIIKKLESELAPDIQVVYREFPLKTVHKNAELAALVAESAGRQGKFWEMHDLLFENQIEWSQSDKALDIFIGYGKKIGINTVIFKNDINTSIARSKVEQDIKTGLESGVLGTPTFFLNGKKLDNPKSYEEFKNTILLELKSRP